MQSVVGNMGEPLAHGTEDENEDDEVATEVLHRPDAVIHDDDSEVRQSAAQQPEDDGIYEVRR